MPRVGLYRGDTIRREGTTAAKFVPADFDTSALGESLQRAGRFGSEYIERDDQIQELYDIRDADALDLEHIKQTQTLSDRLREARGAGAREAATALAGELETYNRDLLTRARSERSRERLDNSITRRTVGEVERYQSYADEEFEQDFRATNDASVQASLERATDIPDEELARDELESTAFALIRQRAEFEGWEGGAGGVQAQQYRLRVSNVYHMNRARQLARDDPQAAIDYAIANRAEMTDEALNGVLDSLNSEAIEQRMTAFVDGQGEFTPPPAAEEGPAPAPRNEEPLQYEWGVNSGYGPRVAPRTSGGNRGSSNHAGVDYAAPAGAPVPVRLSGRVIFAGRRGGYGNAVEVSHGNGLTTMYAHLSRIDVRLNQQVDRGTPIGAVGATGNTSGPHLHYETRQDGRPVDPATIRTARVHPGGTRSNRPDPGANVEALVDSIRTNETLSWRERQVAEQIVRRRHGEAVQARQIQEDNADRSAASQVAELGENFTSMSQLPNSGADLSPQDRVRYSGLARQNREARENVPPSPELMLWVSYNRFANPGFYMTDQFLQEARRRGASAAMLRNIATDQGQMLGTRIPAERGRIWSIADPILQEAGIDFERLTPGQDDQQNAAERQEDARRRNALLGNLERLHDAWVAANPGAGPPPDNVIREWVSRTVLESAQGRFNILSEDDASILARMHPNDRARAERDLRSVGLPVNDRNILEMFRRRIALTRRRAP